MFQNILVTGSMGFVGRSLVPALSLCFPDAQIHAMDSGSDRQGLDIRDEKAVAKLLETTEPDAVVNLAAISHIPTSFSEPKKTWDVNLQGTLNLLNGLQERERECVFLQIGSGDCYGDSFKLGIPVTEETPFKPLNPYAASKAAADIASYSYRNSCLKIIRARPFNHTASGQSNQFVVSAFAEQIALAERGQKSPSIQVGNLDAQRCFLHLNDVVDAYLKLLLHSQSINSGDAFNIASDSPVEISMLLNQLLDLSEVEISVEVDPERMRPTDIPIACADSGLIKQATGWHVKVGLREMLLDVLEFWRKAH